MRRLDHIEKSVTELSAEELAEFTLWFEELQARRWDACFESDASDGALDRLADEALAEHASGRTRPL